MPVPRRDFMKMFGVSLGSLLLTRCQKAKIPEPSETPFVLCYEMILEPTATEACTPPLSARGRLRLCWLRFDKLAEKTREAVDQGNGGWEEDPVGARMIADHRAALDELVAGGEVAASVADLIQEAYEAAVFHLWRSNVPMTCYEPMIVDYAPAGAQNLVNQSETLAEMAASGTIDPATLIKARLALEHDLAYYALTDADVQALFDQILKEYQESGAAIPSFEELQLELTPDVKTAASFLLFLLTTP
jgi:hypothetical protein